MVAVVSMLAVITALGRTLSIEEFGVYGLALSFSLYLVFVQSSVGATAIKHLAEATDDDARNRAFSTAMAVYLVFGAAAGLLIAAAGIAILQLFDIPSELRDQARLGVVAIGAGTALGWPMTTYQDVLRGTQRFALAAVAEASAYLSLAGAILILLLVVDAPLWILIGLAGSIPLLIGTVSVSIVAVQGLRFHFRRHTLNRAYTRSFLRFSLYVLASSVTDLIVYSADRAVLAAFRPAATVGLYEAAVRPHNLVRQLHGSLAQVVLPASARYLEEGDEMRVRELLLRGTRYMLAATVPFTIVFMTLAQPILTAWLGPEFGQAGTALTIFVSYWLVNASTGVPAIMLTAVGRVRALAIYSWSIAVLNLTLSLVMTPALGLNGVVLATTIAYVALAPMLFYLTFTTLPVSIREFARRVWLPAYSLAFALASVLLGLRFTVGLEGVSTLVAAAIISALAYWVAFYGLWMDPSEREFVRMLVRAQQKR